MRDDTRPDRRPDWLERKHSKQPASPRLTDWADRTLGELYGIWDQAVPIGPYDSQQAAQAAKNALYAAVNKRWNRRNPDEELSLSANLTDPADGKCYARGKCRCEQNGCQPTPGPGWYIHARLYDKADGRAHQGRKPVETWDYPPPGGRRTRQRPTDPAPATAGPGPGQRFGGSKRVPPDPAPAGPRLFSGPAATGKPPRGRSSDSRGQPQREQPQEGSLFDRMRRSLGG